MIDEPIIRSMLDDDLYKFNMGSVVFHDFPNAVVSYKFILRSKVPFPKGFDIELQKQLEMLSKLEMTDAEADWMRNSIKYQRPTYIEWLRHYRMDPREVEVKQVNGTLTIIITGYWYRTIYWEVKLMAIISELYFRMTNQPASGDWKLRIQRKTTKLSENKCHWIDFSTRRRHSYEVQANVVEIMRDGEGFLGTSNPHFAMKYGVIPSGTYAHECIMAMSALYGPLMADRMWRKHWAAHFNGNVGIALTDTFTSKVFYRDFDTYDARLFDGVRVDSGENYEQGIRAVDHYKRLRIPSQEKRLVFSNGLDTDTYVALDQYFRKFIQPCGGIGTHFANDIEGIKPLNMVIKLATADFGNGSVGVVKLSDDPGKHTGNLEDVNLVKATLGLPVESVTK
jgi:nicotinate phosphoribosyltransferase